MRKCTVFLLTFFFLLTSCDLFYPDAAENRTVYLFSVALDYVGTSMNSLHGAVNDQSAMISQFEFLAEKTGTDLVSISFTARQRHYYRQDISIRKGAEESVRTELSGHDMKESIFEALSELRFCLKENDIFIFYYAGHGANSSNKNNEHLNGALVVGNIYFPDIGYWQEEAGNMSSLIELSALKKAMSAFCCPKLVILDSCYSGSIYEEDDRLSGRDEILSAVLSLFTNPDVGSNGFYFMSASRSDELSYEDDSAGLAHGFFSAGLLTALGWQFHSPGIEGPGLPSDPVISVAGLYEALNGHELWSYQSPVLNRFYIDLVLFTL